MSMHRNPNDWAFEDELVDLFEEYTIEYPSDFEIQKTIHTLCQYVPKKKRTLRHSIDDMVQLINRSGQEVLYIHAFYWITTLLFFALGFYFTMVVHSDPYLMIATLSPVPFLLGLFEVFKGREHGLLEIEMACKFSVQQIFLSRLLVISAYHFVLTSLLAILLTNFDTSLAISKLLMYWFTPLTIVAAISFTIASKVRGGVVLTSLLTCWLIIGVSLFQIPLITEWFEHVSIIYYLILIILSVSYFTYQCFNLKRSVQIETFN